MPYLIARQRVADFSNWKRVFDSHQAVQRQSGLRVERVLRNLDAPDYVFVLFQVTDLEKARGFVSSPEVPEAKRQSGVVGDTDIYFLY